MLLGIILAGAWAIMYATSTMSSRMSANSVATTESQFFMRNIDRELMQADNLKSLGQSNTTNADAQGAFALISPRDTIFYLDLYGDGRIEKVEYTMSGQSLVRKEWKSLNSVYPFTWPSNPNTTTVAVKAIDPAWSGPIFTYYTDDAIPPTEITNVSQVASVTAVCVQVKNLQTWSNQSASYGASSTARVRAIDNKF